jgi:hypothetical protein
MTAQPGQPLTRGSIYGEAASRAIDGPPNETGMAARSSSRSQHKRVLPSDPF